MKLRLAPVIRAMHFHGLGRIAERWRGMDSLLRTGQLILILWLAFLGAQFAAKSIVQAGILLLSLLH